MVELVNDKKVLKNLILPAVLLVFSEVAAIFSQNVDTSINFIIYEICLLLGVIIFVITYCISYENIRKYSYILALVVTTINVGILYFFEKNSRFSTMSAYFDAITVTFMLLFIYVINNSKKSGRFGIIFVFLASIVITFFSRTTFMFALIVALAVLHRNNFFGVRGKSKWIFWVNVFTMLTVKGIALWEKGLINSFIEYKRLLSYGRFEFVCNTSLLESMGANYPVISLIGSAGLIVGVVASALVIIFGINVVMKSKKVKITENKAVAYTLSIYFLSRAVFGVLMNFGIYIFFARLPFLSGSYAGVILDMFLLGILYSILFSEKCSEK